jgi:hypothetical protein
MSQVGANLPDHQDRPRNHLDPVRLSAPRARLWPIGRTIVPREKAACAAAADPLKGCRARPDGRPVGRRSFIGAGSNGAEFAQQEL